MKLTNGQRRTAKKLALPLAAVGLMTAMMFLDWVQRPTPIAHSATARPAAAAAARVPHGRL
ncbi:MAG TPA: hypothetical protein VFQ53_23495 [Kofleriaceae bacterium]|nr:hypothetical protein [Kofleriaceae bacterium]